MTMSFSSTQQAVSWFRDQHLQGRLEIRPPFQRKPVWSAKQKHYLLETVLLGLPVPEVYVQQITTPTGETRYAVVDGQQRIRSVLQFIGVETMAGQTENNKFSLDTIDPNSEFYGVSIDDLDDTQKIQFFDYQFAVRMLKTSDEKAVRDMFGRLNRNMSPLRPQELRNAIYQGPFARLAEKLSEDPFWAKAEIVTAASIRRMGDIEFVAELLIGLLHGPQGGSAKVIDTYYSTFEEFDDEFPGQKAVVALFSRTLNAIRTTFRDLSSSRWSNKTDFYSLFVALSTRLHEHDVKPAVRAKMEKALIDFGEQVTTKLSDEAHPVTKNVARYVRNVEKGANEKARRAERHDALLALLKDEWFAKQKSA